MDSNNETNEILREILKWTKFQGMQRVKEVLEVALDTEAKRLVYHLSDGRPSPAIAKSAPVSSSTVRRLWKEWAAMGIAEIHPAFKKRYRRIFSLKRVGIEIPDYEGSGKS
jgi:hypothetical protein